MVGQLSYSNQPLVKQLPELLQFGQLLLLSTAVFLLSFLGLDLPPEASNFALCTLNCPKLLFQRVQALVQFVLKIDVPFNQRTRLADAGDRLVLVLLCDAVCFVLLDVSQKLLCPSHKIMPLHAAQLVIDPFITVVCSSLQHYLVSDDLDYQACQLLD